MTHFARVAQAFRGAWPTTFTIHVFQALLAGTFAVPIALAAHYPDLSLREPVAAWVSAMRLGASLGPDTARHALLPLAVAALNYPWLSVAWLRALGAPDPFLVHARFALARYRVACTIAVANLFALALLAAAAGGTAYLVVRFGWDKLDERGLDLACVATTVPFAGLACVALTLQDAAYAAVSRGASGVRAASRAAFRELSVRLLALRIALIQLQLAIGVGSWLASRLYFGAGVWADLGVFAITQSAALLLTCTRAGWLALVLTQPGSGSRAPRAAGSTLPTR